MMLSMVLDALSAPLIWDTKWNFDRWVMSCIFLFYKLLWKWYCGMQVEKVSITFCLTCQIRKCMFFCLFFFFLINNICITHLTRAALCKLISKSRFFPASSYQTSCQLYVPTGCVCPVQVAGDKQRRF